MPPKPSAELGKLLGRENGALPSIITLIDRENLKPEPIYDKHVTFKRLEEFTAAFKKKGKHGSMREFALLMDAYTASDMRDKENMHPSELMTACSRAMYYRVTDVVPTNKVARKIDAKTMRTFDVGKWYHLYIQNLLFRAGVLEKHEAPFHNIELNLIGSADGILMFELTIGTVRAILEIKSIGDFGFQDVLNKGGAKIAHLQQASIYAKELNCPYIVFLYINKNTSDMFEKVYSEKDFKQYQEDAYNIIHGVNDAVTNKYTPNRVCKSPLDSTALECPYCNHCFNL